MLFNKRFEILTNTICWSGGTPARGGIAGIPGTPGWFAGIGGIIGLGPAGKGIPAGICWGMNAGGVGFAGSCIAVDAWAWRIL